jgi:hypothetical protein
VFIAVDAEQVVSFFVVLYAVKSVHLSQSLDKLLRYVALVFQFGLQGVLLEAGVLGGGAERSRQPSLEWIAQTLYFFMCPLLFIVLIVAVLSLCREAPRLAGRSDGGLLMDSHRALTEGLALLFCMLVGLFACLQVFLATLARHFASGKRESVCGAAIGGLAASLLGLVALFLRRRSLQ